jgi:VanZ family protein
MWRPLRYRRLWLALGLLGILAVLVVCLLPRVPGPTFAGADKLEHLLTWFVVAAWFAALLERRAYPFLAMVMVGLGVGIELAQHFMALGRAGDWRDVVANSLGVGAGLLAAALKRDSWLLWVEKWLPAT